jgi:uncharacterized protein YycO
MEDLTALLAQEQLSAADYDALFFTDRPRDARHRRPAGPGCSGREQILAIQRQFFAAPATVCAELFGLLVREDRLAPDENGQPVWGPPMPTLEDGDVLLTYATHSMGWRHGHAGLVVDAAGQKVLEAVVIGSDAAVTNLGHWRSYSNYLVLRLREKSPELQSELTTWALEHLEGVPYRLFSGLLGPKAPDPGLPGFGVQCAHLIWYAFQQFSYDVDADGGRLVTVDDLARSPCSSGAALWSGPPAMDILKGGALMIPVLQSRWRLVGQYLMNYGLRQPLQPARSGPGRRCPCTGKSSVNSFPEGISGGSARAAGCVRSAVSSPGNALSSPLATHLPVPVGEKYHSMSPSPLLRFFPSIRFPHKYVKPPGGRLHSQVLFDLIDGVFLQPGHLSLGDPHLRRHLHLSLALKKAEV